MDPPEHGAMHVGNKAPQKFGRGDRAASGTLRLGARHVRNL